MTVWPAGVNDRGPRLTRSGLSLSKVHWVPMYSLALTVSGNRSIGCAPNTHGSRLYTVGAAASAPCWKTILVPSLCMCGCTANTFIVLGAGHP